MPNKSSELGKYQKLVEKMCGVEIESPGLSYVTLCSQYSNLYLLYYTFNSVVLNPCANEPFSELKEIPWSAGNIDIPYNG